MEKQELNDYKEAGEIAQKVVTYAKSIIKPNMLLVEIAEKIDAKIEELGAISAFPVNLSINEIAAHYHPTLEDTTLATGLLKIDLGIHINGFVADTAFSLDLTPEKKYKELIKASEEALANALKKLEENPTLNEVGETVQKTIEAKGFSPIVNLSGHGLEQYQIHTDVHIPNYANGNKNKLKSGAYAIEPFATTGVGKIYEGPSGNIFLYNRTKKYKKPNSKKNLRLYLGQIRDPSIFSSRSSKKIRRNVKNSN
jgi:methionyl aminopeptidase